MSPFRFFGSLRHRLLARLEKSRLLRGLSPEGANLTRGRWGQSLTKPTEFYAECFVAFHHLPEHLRAHRQYFTMEQRGFGEEAFHVMWWMLFNEFRPARFLEIGVYRGQSLSLAALLQKGLGLPEDVTGISPFASAGDAVSRYRGDVDYLADTQKNFRRFGLQEPHLHKGFSTDSDAVALIQNNEWSCIYIDGNHDYEVALADWKVCSASVASGGLIVLDDSALGTAYRPPAFATAGHPGPSRVASEIDPAQFNEILRVGHNRVYQKL